jgi:uracil-DNA glycosylase family 4
LGKGFFTGSSVARKAPPPRLPQCGACNLFKGCNTPKMAPSGKGGRRVFFVGEAPGKNDDEAGTHFVGNAGERLRRVLDTLDFHLDRDAIQTNAIICHPPKGRTPTANEVAYCRPNLKAALEAHEPHVIVPLGGSAVSSVLGHLWRSDVGSIARWTGWRIPVQNENVWVCPTWHPSHLLTEDDPVLDRQFKGHLEAALALEGRPWDPVPDWRKDVKIVLNPEDAAKWLRRCAAQTVGAIAFDYEANMLKPEGADARCVSCSVAYGRGREPEKCIAYPWHGEAIEATGELLRSPIPKIAANMKFEDRWTRKLFGHRVRNLVWCTCIGAHVADNREEITSVKFQAFVRLGMPPWNEHIEPFLKSKGDARVNQILREIDIKDLLLYNGLDSVLEYRVAVHQMDEMGFDLPWECGA